MTLEKRKILVASVLLVIAVILPIFFRDSRYYMNIFNLAGIFIILNYVYTLPKSLAISLKAFSAPNRYLNLQNTSYH